VTDFCKGRLKRRRLCSQEVESAKKDQRRRCGGGMRAHWGSGYAACDWRHGTTLVREGAHKDPPLPRRHEVCKSPRFRSCRSTPTPASNIGTRHT